MTNAIVGNVTELIAAPRMDNVQPKKGEENFAGSLKKAVEKGEKPEHDALKNEVASKNPEADRKQVESESKSASKNEHIKATSEKDSTLTEKKTVDSKEMDLSADENEEMVAGVEEALMTAALQVQSDTPITVDTAATELVVDAANEMFEQLSEALEMPVAEIQETMNSLGISTADLFVPENITQIFTEVTGVEDSISLVMDEALYQTWQDLNESVGTVVEQLTQELDVASEELLQTVEAALENLQAEDGNVQMMQDLSVTAEKTPIGAAETPEVARPVFEAIKETNASQDVQTSEMKGNREIVAVYEEGKQVETVDEETVVVEETKDASSEFLNQTFEKQEGGSVKGSGAKRENAAEQGQVTTQNLNFAGNTVDFNAQNRILFNQVEGTQTETLETMSHDMRTEEIADQIMEYMKVQMNEDVKELEMQLHPASLGNVHVSLVSREGNITAQFTAQNEAVKAVMETQLVQLKEQFEEQGIKVDAVEVAVSNHQFEKQYSGDEQKESQRNDRNKVRTRRINLDELSEEDLDKLLTDEEKLQADMMKQNGNTVDYTA